MSDRLVVGGAGDGELPGKEPLGYRLVRSARRTVVLGHQFGVQCGGFGEAARERLGDTFVQRAP